MESELWIFKKMVGKCLDCLNECFVKVSGAQVLHWMSQNALPNWRKEPNLQTEITGLAISKTIKKITKMERLSQLRNGSRLAETMLFNKKKKQNKLT